MSFDKVKNKNSPGNSETTPVTQDDIENTRVTHCQFDGCNRRLGLTSYPCYCDKYFCAIHMPAENHNCSFNYKEATKKKLSEELEKVEAEKIRKI